jgi:hypothetical protein
VLRTDGGKEFSKADEFCQQVGIARQKTEPYNPASNGKAERMIRTLMSIARTNLLASNLALGFWGDAILDAAYKYMRLPCRANKGGMSPLQVLTNKVSNVADLVPFGTKCSVLVSHKQEGKTKELWAPRALPGRIIGRSEEVKGMKVYIPKTNSVVISQHICNGPPLHDNFYNLYSFSFYILYSLILRVIYIFYISSVILS